MAKTETIQPDTLTPEAIEAVHRLQAVTEMAGTRLAFAEAVQIACNTCAGMGVSALMGLK